MRFAIIFATLFALTSAASAQVVVKPPLPDRFTGTTPNILQPGQELEVHFTDSNTPNQTVQITAEKVGSPPESVTFSIELNASGEGQTDWTPPSNWEGVTLKHPSSQDHTVPIDN